jgi:hypothetical protein
MDKQEEIVRQYVDAYNDFDVEKMLADLHPEVGFVSIVGGVENMRLKGKENFRQQAESVKDFFSERQQEITSILIENDTIELRISYKGTIAKDLPNGWKKGFVIQLQGKSVFTFLNDKITRIVDMS